MNFEPSQNHWKLRGFKERVRLPELQKMLLDPFPIIRGCACEWRHRRIGPGVYEVWAEDKTYGANF